ncbi:MAG: hypothetical protein H6832_17290 [Planctomycetes bacterium]|nr:hypothetical protein [Planctomycetota bacterium]MCB9920159.1 hypothetical protein [Planctomycetota bacterium]
MAENLWPALASNLAVTLAIGIVAHVVHATRRYPAFAHILWVLALLKLITPSWIQVHGIAIQAMPFDGILPEGSTTFFDAPGAANAAASVAFEAGTNIGEEAALAEPLSSSWWSSFGTMLVSTNLILSAWFVGVLVFGIVPLVRASALHKLLRRSARPLPIRVRTMSRDVAHAIGLRRVPVVHETEASVAPFTWAMFGRAIVVVPRPVVEALDDAQLCAVLLHEFTHVKRFDPLVRWLEWAVVALHWWNPLAWWIRHRIRIDEELACDAQVLAHGRFDRRNYANSLLSVAECLVTTAVRPPVFASGIDSGGNLERRIKMIAFGRIAVTPRGLRLVAALLAVVVLPMSFARAQDFRAVERRLGAAIEAGELTIDQARIMMDALRKSVASRFLEQKNDRESAKRIAEVREKIAMAVREGKLSKEDARRKLTAYEDALRKDQQNEEMKLRAEKFRSIKDDIREAVKRGAISEKDAKKKLAAAQEKLFSDRKRPEPETDEAKTKQKYEAAVKRIKDAVKDGKLDKKQAEAKLIALKKSIYVDESTDLPARLEKFRLLQDEINAAVREGRLDKNEAKSKLADLQLLYFGGANQDRRGK